MVQIPQASDETYVRREELDVSLQLLRKYFNVECDSLLLLLKELIGGCKHLRLRNQDNGLHDVWLDLGREEIHVKNAESVLKADSDAAENGTHLPSLRLKQRHRSKKKKRRISKSEWLPKKDPIFKRRESCDIKLSPSDASLYEGDEAANGENKPGAICQGYIVVDFNDKESMILFYHYCFHSIGAVCMKKILKAWIKVIEPKKQVKYPYKGGERTKPKWWPTTTEDINSNCRHMEPDHLWNNERLVLAVWLSHLVDVKRLRYSTQQIAASLDEKYRENAINFLDSLYTIRELEQGHEDDESGGHCQISLNIPRDRLQKSARKKPAYRYPTKDERRARERFLAQAQVPPGSLPCNIGTLLDERFAMDSEGKFAGQQYLHSDLGYQQNTASYSSVYTGIAIPGSALPYTKETPYLYEVNSLQRELPPSFNPSNSAFCESLDGLTIQSTIKAEQASVTVFNYDEHDIASFPSTVSTGLITPLPAHTSISELQSDGAYQDTYMYGQVDLTAWPSNHLPIQNRTVPDNSLLCTPNGYNQMPEPPINSFDLAINHPDHSGEPAAEEPQWQSQMRDDAAFGAPWPLSEFDRLLCIAEGV